MAVPPSYHKLFMTMCPTYAFIDRADGKINRAMDYKKDYSALLSAAWDIDACFDEYLINPGEESYGKLDRMGLSPFYDGSAIESSEEIVQKMADGKIKGPFAERFFGAE